MAERKNMVPPRWLAMWRNTKDRLGVTAADIVRTTHIGRKTVEGVANGRATSARRSTLIQMTEALPLPADALEKAELLAELGIRQRALRIFSISWGGNFGTFGTLADQILGEHLSTRDEHQLVGNIALPRIQSIAIAVHTISPQKAADLPL